MKTGTRYWTVPAGFFTIAVIFAVMYSSGLIGSIRQSYGGEWSNLSGASEEKSFRAVAVDPLNPQRIFVTSSGGVLVSSDGGTVWTNCLDLSSAKKAVPAEISASQKAVVSYLERPGEQGQLVGGTAIAVDPANPQRIYAGSVDGLYLCSDGGKSWTKANGAMQGVPLTVLDISIDGSNPDLVYAATMGAGLIRSANGGKSWEKVEVAPGAKAMSAVAVNPLDSNVVYAATSDAVMKSKDGGKAWEKVYSPTAAPQSLSVDQVNPDVLYLGTSSGLYKSVDGGQNWNGLAPDTLGQKSVREVAVAPSNSKSVYVASDGVYGSSDGGQTWQQLSKGSDLKGAMALAFDPLDASVLWAATADGLYRTSAGKAVAETAASALPPAEAKEAAAGKAEEVVPEETKPAETQVEAVTVEETSKPQEGETAAKAAGPPVPTIDDVQTVLGQFSHEPTVQEVQEVAMRFAEVHPDLIEGWRKGAKYRALLPEFTLSLDQDTKAQSEYLRSYRTEDRTRDFTKSYDKTEITPNTAYQIDDYDEIKSEVDHRRWSVYSWGDEFEHKRSVELKFKWDLGDFLYNPDQVRISDEARDLVELRNDVLEEVTQFYFQRRNAQIDLLLSPPEDLRDRLRMEIQLQEVTANIDYLTGGYLTQRLNDAKQGKTRKSNILKRMFSI